MVVSCVTTCNNNISKDNIHRPFHSFIALLVSFIH